MKKKWKVMGGIALALACVLSSCSKGPSSDSQERKLKPNYLLTGTLTSSDDVFDYYCTGQDESGHNEYAISLKSSLKETYTGVNNTITIPSVYPNDTDCKVTGIWHDAFYKNPATGISFGSSSNIKTIDFEAFMYSGINNITLPYTVEEMGDGAFYACPNLTKVTFVNSNQESSGSATDCACEDCVEDTENNNEEVKYCSLTVIPSLCFFKCNKLAELSLPSSIEEICEEAFNGCSELKTDLFFQNILTIRSRAFQGCTSLSNVYISKSLFENPNNDGIEPHAFNYCDSSLSIKFCGTSEKVTNWVNNHQRWGWHVDRENPSQAQNSYSYVLTTGDNYFTADWQYTVDTYNNVTITKFNGKASDITKGFISIPDHMPTPANNKVIYISREAFTDDVKAKLKRIYLPTTLMSIANWMFNSKYDNLYVIDDNNACPTDYTKEDSQIQGRIDLSGLTNLEFIGIRAFAGIGEGNTTPKAKEKIKTLHLPAKIKAIGGEAFGIFGFRKFPGVTKFIWDYDESVSCLETIGTDAFYGLGILDTSPNKSTEITGNLTHRKHTSSTIIFPKTFKYFGMLGTDISKYQNQDTNKFNFNETAPSGYGKPAKETRPAHAFAGCSLLAKVVFKGSLVKEQTTDLVIPVQTFVYNESLHTIIFEERKGWSITFHTQQGTANNNDWAQEAIGGNSGRGKNDFRGEPFLQTIVIPNKETTIRFQDFAFHANSRAAMYLSGTYGTNMYSDNKNGHWKNMSFENMPLENAQQWRTIGDETYYNSANRKQYHGYCFGAKAYTNYSDSSISTYDESLNTFSIDQKIPVYDNVHFVDEETGAEVGKNNSKQVVIKEKCAFVCEKVGNNYVATMSKYLYNLYDHSTGELLTNENNEVSTAIIPETVDAKDENNTTQTYTVTKIGDSAFSACFCDGQDTNPVRQVGNFPDLDTVVLPNTITHIGEYAFIRAYGIKTIKSYTGNDTPEERMPSSLKHIGKNAFLFTDIKKFLKIPYDCLFYETENDTHNITSVFANDTGLRAISFMNANNTQEVYTSKYYSVTTYTSSDGHTYACALYSNKYTGNDECSGETLYNENKLLLVLNRDYNDNKKPSSDATVTTSNDGLRFNGQHKDNEFLFGAFKMGYWIKELNFGKATTSDGTNTYTQPLFSAIGTRGSPTDTLVYKAFYLGCNGDGTDSVGSPYADYAIYGNKILYKDLACDITTIAGEVFSLPSYGLNGCENLTKTELGYKENGVLPDGVFANITNRDTQYITGGQEGNQPHVLDLRTTGYIKVGKDTFKNNASIDKFIAPDVANFTIDESAFDSCANLTTLDLSAVTGNITINPRAFANTPITSITWPSSPCTVTIADGGSVGGAFESCTSLTTVSLPPTLQTKLGSSAFKNCTALTTVTIDGASIGITTIGNSAFESCSSLDSFDFSKFTSLTTIGNSAFKETGKVNNSGNVSLPNTVTTIGASAFYGSDIKTMTINSSSISLGASAFESCTSLTAVRFTVSNCSWSSYNASVFNGCTSLEELQLPSGFNLKNTNYNYENGIYFIYGDSIINIYVYEKFSTSAEANEDWRKKSNETVELNYFVESVSDLLSADVISSTPTVLNTTKLFWTTDANGVAINLGTVVSYDGATVTFSNGSTLTGNVFTHQ